MADQAFIPAWITSETVRNQAMRSSWVLSQFGDRWEQRTGRLGAPESVQAAFRSPGRPLDAATRLHGEPRGSHDFSQVTLQALPVAAGNCPMSLVSPRACPFGGACHTCPARVQTKLAMNQPGDVYEQEADRIAEAITQTAEPTVVQRKCVRCSDDEDEELQRKEAPDQTWTSSLDPGASSAVREVLRSSGQPLDLTTRALMEARFGHDFSHVRIHTDGKAAESAQAVNALAYTMGRDVVFGAGRYAPATHPGQELLLHELTHVVQQGDAGPVDWQAISIGEPDGHHELEASRNASIAAPSSRPVFHRTRPLLQRQPAQQQSLRDRICYRPGLVIPQRQPTDCDVREPENCPTYELWLNAFSRLRTTPARDTSPGGRRETGINILGDRARRPVDALPEPPAVAPGPPPPAISPGSAERFIDHPTNTWVQTCLPPNLRETAYRLPTDCADIAVILRHVWLSAHHRTQTFSGWTIGDRAGRAMREQVSRVISGRGGGDRGVHSGNVRNMLNPYSDSSGQLIRSFAGIQNLLHPGDVLVWEHHEGGFGTARSGGHTQTISNIIRQNGRITRIDVMAGNMPMGPRQAQEIVSTTRGAPSEWALRNAPGRRIELQTLVGGNLGWDRDLPVPRGQHPPAQPTRVWTWRSDEHTTLLAAGPPASVQRPAMRSIEGVRIRRLSDWHRPLLSARAGNLLPILEAALLELRSMIDGGQTGLDRDATELGRIAGERLWTLARQAGQSRAGDLAEETHFRPLQQMRTMIRALGAPATQQPTFSSHPSPAAAEVRRVFNLIDDAFHLAARGATTISFTRPVPRGRTLIRMLVTGFDPFVSSGTVPPGEINPSGAAALAMDNTEVRESQYVAAVEGIVLPVSFNDFRSGMVERIVRPLVQSRSVDAILTVSLAARIAPTQPVQLERFVVGVRGENGALGPVPATGGASIGPAIIETPAPVEQISAETERQPRPHVTGIPRPAIGTGVTFRFSTSTIANQALAALGLPPTANREVSIGNVTALQEIIRTMQRSPNGIDITFQAGGRSFQATVVKGPGGNFLSNEVSYRILRLLGQEHRLDIPSFHVHVQRPLPNVGDRIPQDVSSPAARQARQQAIRSAIGVRNRLIDTLSNMIRAVARRIMARLHPTGQQTP